MKKNNLIFAFMAVMFFVSIIIWTSKNPAVIPVRWFGFYALIAGFVAFLLRDKKKVYKSGDRVINLGEVLYKKNIFYLIPNDPREKRLVKIQHNDCLEESKQWQALFFKEVGSKLVSTEYASTAEELVPLAIRYIMRDEEFDFLWDGTMGNQWIVKK